MAYTNIEIRKFHGLFLQANSFEVPDGAMEVAENVALRSDGVISKLPGFYTYWAEASGPLSLITSLTQYQDRLIGFFQGSGVGYYLSATIAAPQPEQRGVLTANGGLQPTYTANSTRTSEQNLNLYFNGYAFGSPTPTYKLEAYNGNVRLAGMVPGESLMSQVLPGATGPLPAGSQSAYRFVYGRRDTNGNLTLSSPSDIETIGVADPEIGAAYTRSGGGPYTVIVVTTAPTGYRVGDSVVISGGSDPDVNGTQVITATPNPFEFHFSVVADPGASGTLDFSADRTAVLEIELGFVGVAADNYFVQIYRTDPSVSVDTTPDPDTFGLIAEIPLTALDISNGVIFFQDDIAQIFKGELLYTNPNSREGELSANFPPPFANDTTEFKDFAFYANTQIDGRMTLNLIADGTILDDGDTFTLTGLGSTVFLAVESGTQVGNQLVTASAVSGTSTITVTYNGHGFATGDVVFIRVLTGTGNNGPETITVLTANTFTYVDTGSTPLTLQFEGIRNVAGQYFWFVGTNTASTAFNITMTAKYLVKAINRQGSYTANYVSSFNDFPGNIAISRRGGMFTALTNIPDVFIQTTDVAFSSDDIAFPERLYFSKFSEPEAVPVLNFFKVGSRNKPILRIWALPDALIILKTDGIFKLVGDQPENFTITEIDLTIFGLDNVGFVSPYPSNHGCKINNTVLCLTNQGVVEIDENSARIISRRIDDLVQPIIGNTISFVNFFAYETQRLAYMSIVYLDPSNEYVRQTLVYNVMNGEWTTTTQIFFASSIGPGDIMYMTPSDPVSITENAPVMRQRKELTLLDYANEFLRGTITVAADRLSGTIVLTGGSVITAPLEGSTLFYNSRITRIIGITTVDAVTYDLLFDGETNVPAATPTVAYIYQPITSIVKFAPFHAGNTGLSKFYAQFQVHMRQQQMSELLLLFAGAYYGSSETTDWDRLSLNYEGAGWGLEPWGLFPWGNPRSVQLLAGTRAAIIIRTYVPRYAARNSFIQPILSHAVAAEAMMIQAISWNLRTFGERVSK